MNDSLYHRGSSAGAPREGPCLMVTWRDARPGSLPQVARYFPPADQGTATSEDVCFEWFASRRSIVVKLTWSWGEVPAWVTKRRRVALG